MNKLDIDLKVSPDEINERYKKYIDSYRAADLPIKTFDEWKNNGQSKEWDILSGYGQQRVINKINKIVEWIEKQEPLLDNIQAKDILDQLKKD